MRKAFRGYRRALRLLERYCPIDRPVRIVFVPMRGQWGDSDREGKGFIIRLRAGMDESLGLDALAHEWGHIRAWFKTRVLHGERDFAAYSRAYRVLIEGWRPKRRA